MNKVVKISLPALLLATTTGLQAATPGFYVGGGAGYSVLESDKELRKKDNGVLGARAFAGYNFNRYLGAEFGYSYLGTTKYHHSKYSDLGKLDVTSNALSLVAKGYLPLPNDKFNIYGLVGGAEVYNRFALKQASEIIDRDRSRALVATAGAGASYEIDSNLTAGIEVSVFGSRKASNHSFGSPQATLGSIYLAYSF